VAASGGLLIVQGAGAVAGPIVAGLAMSVLQRGLSLTLVAAQILMAAFGVYQLDTPSSPACDAQRNFRGRAAYPSCDHARVGTFERWFTQQNSVVSCEPSGNADRSQMVREKFRPRAAPVRMMSSAVRCPKVP